MRSNQEVGGGYGRAAGSRGMKGIREEGPRVVSRAGQKAG